MAGRCVGYFGVFRRTAPEVQTRFGRFGFLVPATSFREQSVMSGCHESSGAMVRHETGTSGPKYPIAPGDSWPGPVIRNNRTEFELRVLCVGILRSIPRTAPPCFQYTDFSLRRRLFPLFPPAPSVSLNVNSDFRLKPDLPFSLVLSPTYWWF